MRISDMPPFISRFGRFYDGIMVMTCGFRVIEDIEECIICGAGKYKYSSK